MDQFIHNLRQRPEEHRRHILHVSTVVIVVIMVLVWFISLGSTLSSVDLNKKVTETVKPTSALKANLVDGYKSIYNPEIPEPKASDLSTDVLE